MFSILGHGALKHLDPIPSRLLDSRIMKRNPIHAIAAALTLARPYLAIDLMVRLGFANLDGASGALFRYLVLPMAILPVTLAFFYYNEEKYRTFGSLALLMTGSSLVLLALAGFAISTNIQAATLFSGSVTNLVHGGFDFLFLLILDLSVSLTLGISLFRKEKKAPALESSPALRAELDTEPRKE